MADERPRSGIEQHLTKLRIAMLGFGPLALVSLAYGGAITAYYTEAAPQEPTKAVASVHDGVALFNIHCSNCHGERGDGNGPAHVYPPARYFGHEKFKFASTDNGVPTDDDLKRLLQRGIPGSAMPAFPQLNDEEQSAVVAYVRQLSRRGLYERMWQKADADGDEPSPAELLPKADRLMQIGTPIAKLESYTAAPGALERGKKHFVAICATCHGPEGRGDGPQVKEMKNENGTPARPRDLTQGVYKGGAANEHLYARIMLGIPGTPMPSSSKTLQPADTLDLIEYIRSLAPNAPRS
ncbi:MAG: c-type cytochrome [Gemmataceae bacterium]